MRAVRNLMIVLGAAVLAVPIVTNAIKLHEQQAPAWVWLGYGVLVLGIAAILVRLSRR